MGPVQGSHIFPNIRRDAISGAWKMKVPQFVQSKVLPGAKQLLLTITEYGYVPQSHHLAGLSLRVDDQGCVFA